MSWIFHGTGADISIGVDSAGRFQMSGAGTQTCRPKKGDLRVISETEGVASSWIISSQSLADDDLGFGPMHLRRFFNENGGRTSAAIHFFREARTQTSTINLVMLALPEAIKAMIEIGKAIVARDDLMYSFEIHFPGLETDSATDATPFIGDFLHPDPFKQRPYFTDYVTFSVRAASHH